MYPEAHVAHATKDRLRLKLPSLKNDTVSLELLRRSLIGIEGIRDIEINPLTGGVLIHHSSTQEVIISSAVKNNLFIIKEKAVEKSAPVPFSNFTLNVTNTARSINGKIKSLTGREFDLPNMFFLVLFGTGVFQVARGNFAMPAWYTAFWYAYGVFTKGMPK